MMRRRWKMEVPVSRLFRSLNHPKNVEEALIEIGANFDVERRSAWLVDEERANDGKWLFKESYKKIERYSSIVRTDTGKPLGEGLSIMSDSYGIVQYRDALAFLNEMVGKYQAQMVYASCVDGGRRIYIILRTNEVIDLGSGDKITCFFTVSTSHDGTGQLQAMCTPVHHATQTVFTPMGAGVIKMKHTTHIQERMAQASRIDQKMHEFFEIFGPEAKKLVAMSINDEQARCYYRMMIDKETKRSENIRAKLFDIYKSIGPQREVGSCKNTLFGAMVATWVWADMYKTVHSAGKSGKSELDRKIEARLSGDAAKAKALAYETGLKILKMGTSAWS
jgi:phage/plasmid-like protein (TIGR03299 family)